MNQPLIYLTPTDFSSRIGTISASLKQADIQPYWQQFRENMLTYLLPDDHAFWTWWKAQPRTDHAEYRTLDESLRRWAVYWIWANYILEGDAQQTVSGLTVKKTEESSPVSDRQRSDMYRRYSGIAYRHEQEVTRLLTAPATSCAPTPRRSRWVRVVGNKTRNNFSN